MGFDPFNPSVFFLTLLYLHTISSRDILPKDLTLIASPNNPYHYTHKKSPQKLHHPGDHASRCENTTLFLFGPEGSGWFDIEIADRPSTRPVDILFMRPGAGKGGFHEMSAVTVKHPRAVYYRGRLWIFGKVKKKIQEIASSFW